jgi:hypothetical protein
VVEVQSTRTVASKSVRNPIDFDKVKAEEAIKFEQPNPNQISVTPGRNLQDFELKEKKRP